MRIVVIVILLAAIGVSGFYGYRYWQAPPASVKYVTAPVKRGDVVATVTATGTVEPLIKVLVGSQVSGTVTRWYADFNQEVAEGFLLAELDQDRFQATVDQRQSAVAVAKAQAEEAAARAAQASLDRRRMEDVFARDAASAFEFDTAKTGEDAAVAALHAAEARVQAAEADLRLAKIELEKTKIYAPIAGVVISRDIDAGQTVAASLQAPTLFTIANDLRQMRVNAAVSENDIGKVREGSLAEFRVDAYPERRFRGVVSQVRFAETVVDNVVTYKTLIDVDNSELLLRPGMTATILFEVAKVSDSLMVPNAALRFDPRSSPVSTDFMRPARGQAMQPRVYKLERDQLAEVRVELGLNDGSFTQVKAGPLSEGDVVVIDKLTTGGPPRAAMQRVPSRAM